MALYFAWSSKEAIINYSHISITIKITDKPNKKILGLFKKSL